MSNIPKMGHLPTPDIPLWKSVSQKSTPVGILWKSHGSKAQEETNEDRLGLFGVRFVNWGHHEIQWDLMGFNRIQRDLIMGFNGI